MKPEWFQTSWTLSYGARILAQLRGMTGTSVIVQWLGRCRQELKAHRRQSLGCVVAGSLGTSLVLMMWSVRTLQLKSAAIRGAVLIVFLALLLNMLRGQRNSRF